MVLARRLAALALAAPALARDCGQAEVDARDLTGCVSFKHIKYLNHRGAIWIGDALHNNSALEFVDLHHTHLGDDDALSLAQGLRNNSVLKRLAMHNNRITDVGAAEIGNALAENYALEELSLSSNAISDAGLVAIAEALHVNRVLRRLDLYFNAVGDEGAIALAEALKVNRAIRVVHLDSNSIDEMGGLALAAAIKGSSSLRAKWPPASINELTLSYNSLTNLAVEALAAAAQANPNVYHLKLSHNNRVFGEAAAAREANAQLLQERQAVAEWLIANGLVNGAAGGTEWRSVDGPTLASPTAVAVGELKAHTAAGLEALRHEDAASMAALRPLRPLDARARDELVAVLLRRVAEVVATSHDEL